MAKPSQRLDWLEPGTDPGATIKANGYLLNNTIDHDVHNWLHYTCSEWNDYFEEVTDYVYSGSASRTVATISEMTSIASELSNTFLPFDVTIIVQSTTTGNVASSAISFSNIFGGKITVDFSGNAAYWKIKFDRCTAVDIIDVRLGSQSLVATWLDIDYCETLSVSVYDSYCYSTSNIMNINKSNVEISEIQFSEINSSNLIQNDAIVAYTSKVTIENSTRATGDTGVISSSDYVISGFSGSDIRVVGTNHFPNTSGFAGDVDGSSIGVGPSSGIVVNTQIN